MEDVCSSWAQACLQLGEAPNTGSWALGGWGRNETPLRLAGHPGLEDTPATRDSEQGSPCQGPGFPIGPVLAGNPGQLALRLLGHYLKLQED